MELAKLAAIIAPNAARGPAMTAAMARAMEFYEEAKQFVGELPNDSTALAVRFASDDRRWSQKVKELEVALDATREIERKTAFELDPEADDDSARAFVRTKRFAMKGADTVLRNIREWYGDWRTRMFNPTALDTDALIESFTEQRDGRVIYLLPRWVMHEVVSWKAKNRRAGKLRSYHGGVKKDAVK
jgi:hypothetical protein